MMFISIDSSSGAAPSAAAACATRTDCRRLVHGRQMSGGKGAKGGNLESLGNTGPADDVATRRKLAETDRNWWALPWRRTSGVAEIEENKFYVAVSALRLHPCAITLRITVGSTRAISCRIPLDRVDRVSGDRQSCVRELRKLASHPKGAEQTGSRSFRNSSPTVLAMRLAYVDTPGR